MPTRTPETFPLQICSMCAERYGSSGFDVRYATPSTLDARMDKCSLCGRRLPCRAARLTARPKAKARRKKISP